MRAARRSAATITVDRPRDPRGAPRPHPYPFAPAATRSSTPSCSTSSRSTPTSGSSAGVSFDLDDFDAAIAELDARYLAGEAAAHARTWSLVTGAYAAVNRHELPATTPDWAMVDHRPIGVVVRGG